MKAFGSISESGAALLAHGLSDRSKNAPKNHCIAKYIIPSYFGSNINCGGMSIELCAYRLIQHDAHSRLAKNRSCSTILQASFENWDGLEAGT